MQEKIKDDTISRQAAIDALAKIAREKFNMSDEYNHYLAGLMDGELAIKGLPTIQPEPQEGHWIDKGWDGDWAWQIDGRGNCWRVIECSECGKRVLVESNYCPNCGAKMINK